jgi:hypothetical protein
MMRFISLKPLNYLILAVLACIHGSSQAVDIFLYDATLNQFPESQPWLFYAADSSSGGSVSKNLTVLGTELSTNETARAGWSNTIPILNTWKNPAFPILNPAEGFALEWSMQILSENHNSTDRAGTSLILLGSNGRGIELGFWTHEIWAQNANPLFTHGESAGFDLTAGAHDFRLEIIGDQYLLSSGQNLLLSGITRDYSAFGSAPYSLQNYFFLGDNTTSAGATSQFGSIRLLTNVPETGHTSVIIGILFLLIMRNCHSTNANHQHRLTFLNLRRESA